jgi:hypothetical protein
MHSCFGMVYMRGMICTRVLVNLHIRYGKSERVLLRRTWLVAMQTCIGSGLSVLGARGEGSCVVEPFMGSVRGLRAWNGGILVMYASGSFLELLESA